MADKSALHALLRRGRRRLIWNLTLQQAAFAGSAGLGGTIVLLILGTQILDWYWITALVLGTFVFGIFRIARRVPSMYTVAQVIDRRLSLNDSLSTAYYFDAFPGDRQADPEIRAMQRDSAEQIAASVAIWQAIPFQMPKAAFAAVLLAAVASGIFGLRYGLRNSLDLKPPIAEALFDWFKPSAREVAAKTKSPAEQQLEDFFRQNGITLEDAATEQGLGQTGQQGDRSEPSSITAEEAARAEGQGQQKGNEGTEGETEGEQADGAMPASEESGAQEKQAGNSGDAPRDKQASSQSGNQKGNQENSGLMQKMREAMANLLSKLKIQPPPGTGQQSAQAGKSGQERQKQASSGKGQPAQGKQQGEGEQADSSQGEQDDGSEATRSARGNQGDRNSDQRGSEDSKSGIGKTDGDKDLKAAEQLAAMGKLSEIIGKRAANVTGEVMVEVASGDQRLKTPYSSRHATHAQAGGEIHRDEIPLVYQHYVQQYFEEIRKAPLPEPADSATPAK